MRALCNRDVYRIFEMSKVCCTFGCGCASIAFLCRIPLRCFPYSTGYIYSYLPTDIKYHSHIIVLDTTFYLLSRDLEFKTNKAKNIFD